MDHDTQILIADLASRLRICTQALRTSGQYLKDMGYPILGAHTVSVADANRSVLDDAEAALKKEDGAEDFADAMSRMDRADVEAHS